MKTIKQTRREAKRLYRLCLVNGSLDDSRIRLVAQALVESTRRGNLRLLSRFLHLAKLDRARHTAHVQSATPLASEFQASVLEALTRLYGPGIGASFVQDASLIGGMRIKVGSDVYDGSVRGALQSLERSF
jgi:F-type H+-transporting ATPase subunit delta